MIRVCNPRTGQEYEVDLSVFPHKAWTVVWTKPSRMKVTTECRVKTLRPLPFGAENYKIAVREARLEADMDESWNDVLNAARERRSFG